MFAVKPEEYQQTKPFPHALQENFLDETFAIELQKEILALPAEDFDEYDNLCEKKLTLRDKKNMAPKCREFFERMTNPLMLNHLSQITGIKLLNDENRHYWGIHLFSKGSRLAVHVDAGIHPATGLKKQLTLGYYLSANWKEEYGSEFEVWRGENASLAEPHLVDVAAKFAPLFNRALIFNCDDYAWHGVSDEKAKPADAIRIFLTLSYMSENYNDLNKKTRAFFVPRPNDPNDAQIREFSRKRSSEECTNVYKSMN